MYVRIGKVRLGSCSVGCIQGEEGGEDIYMHDWRGGGSPVHLVKVLGVAHKRMLKSFIFGENANAYSPLHKFLTHRRSNFAIGSNIKQALQIRQSDQLLIHRCCCHGVACPYSNIYPGLTQFLVRFHHLTDQFAAVVQLLTSNVGLI